MGPAALWHKLTHTTIATYHYHLAIRTTTNVSLTPELNRFVEEQVESGRYQTASEVFREGLRLLEKAEQRRLLEKWLMEGLTAEEEARIPPAMLKKAKKIINDKIQVGLDQLDRGEGISGEAVMEELRQRSEKRRRRKIR